MDEAEGEEVERYTNAVLKTSRFREKNLNKPCKAHSAQESARVRRTLSKPSPPKQTRSLGAHRRGVGPPLSEEGEVDLVGSSDDDDLQVGPIARSVRSHSNRPRHTRQTALTFIPLHQRLRGSRHDNLESLEPAETLYDLLMSYRYYRLIDEHQQLRQTSLTPVHRY